MGLLGLQWVRAPGFYTGDQETSAVFLHIPFAALTTFWTRLRPRSLDRANLAYQCGVGIKIGIVLLQGPPCGNLAMRPSPNVKHFGLSEAAGRVSEM